MKHVVSGALVHLVVVAPRRGAWIETLLIFTAIMQRMVAPRRGAWIETSCARKGFKVVKSHPAGVRGLKRPAEGAPNPNNESHPAGVRGLKQHEPTQCALL